MLLSLECECTHNLCVQRVILALCTRCTPITSQRKERFSAEGYLPLLVDFVELPSPESKSPNIFSPMVSPRARPSRNAPTDSPAMAAFFLSSCCSVLDSRIVKTVSRGSVVLFRIFMSTPPGKCNYTFRFLV